MEAFFRSAVSHFCLGEHFAESTLDHRDVDAVWTLEDDGKVLKTIHVDKKSGVEWTVEEGGQVQHMTLRCKDVVCTNTFKRLNRN